ncbi:MAG: phosphoribosyltransferase [SAR202 cluster bacterium]|nr:phosphoribosyltransferase [SAR202 cluster bacterium]
MTLLFRDREEAGRVLGDRLVEMGVPNREEVIVLGLPNGGVPVAYEVARELGCQLDIILVRKLGVPGNDDLAMGAVALGGMRVIYDPVVRRLDLDESVIDRVTQDEMEEIERREQDYRRNLPPADLKGRTVVIVDDGLATGSTMKVAINVARREQPRRVFVAVPVGTADAVDELQAYADDVVCLHTPEPFISIGNWYQDFHQVPDENVRRLLDTAARSNGLLSPAEVYLG